MALRVFRQNKSGDEIIQLAVRLALLAFLLYWSFVLVRPFIPMLAWSMVLTVALYPPYNWLSVHLGGRQKLSAAIVTVTCLLIIIGPATWLGLGMIEGLQDFAGQLGAGTLTMPSPPEGVKDWPILGEVSVIASRMALACKYQDKFIQAHDALIGVNSKLTEPRIRELLAGAGIDVDRASRDLATNAKAIDAILARNNDQATAFGFKGTPSFIVGKFRVPGVLTMEEFGQVIADARKAAASK